LSRRRTLRERTTRGDPPAVVRHRLAGSSSCRSRFGVPLEQRADASGSPERSETERRVVSLHYRYMSDRRVSEFPTECPRARGTRSGNRHRAVAEHPASGRPRPRRSEAPARLLSSPIIPMLPSARRARSASPSSTEWRTSSGRTGIAAVAHATRDGCPSTPLGTWWMPNRSRRARRRAPTRRGLARSPSPPRDRRRSRRPRRDAGPQDPADLAERRAGSIQCNDCDAVDDVGTGVREPVSCEKRDELDVRHLGEASASSRMDGFGSTPTTRSARGAQGRVEGRPAPRSATRASRSVRATWSSVSKSAAGGRGR